MSPGAPVNVEQPHREFSSALRGHVSGTRREPLLIRSGLAHRTRAGLPAAQDRTAGRNDGHTWGETVATSGAFQWPPTGRFSWPPTGGTSPALGDDQAFGSDPLRGVAEVGDGLPDGKYPMPVALPGSGISPTRVRPKATPTNWQRDPAFVGGSGLIGDRQHASYLYRAGGQGAHEGIEAVVALSADSHCLFGQL